MLLDLMSTDNLVSFNVEVAKKLGLHEAIYIQEVLNIISKATRKNKLEGEFVVLDRKYIEDRTLISTNEQLSIDKRLIELQVVTVNSEDNNKILVDIDKLAAIIVQDDPSIIKNMIITAGPKQKKKEAVKVALKNHIKTTNDELRDAYYEWIDVVSSKGINVKTVEFNETQVDNYVNHNLDAALWIVRYTTAKGWKDMKYAIEEHRKIVKPVNVERVVEEKPQGGKQY